MPEPQPSPEPQPTEASRRGFIRGSSLLLASAIPGAGMGSAAIGGSQRLESRSPLLPNRNIKVGLIGCGYRGLTIASQVLSVDDGDTLPNATLTAVADIFPDRLQQAVRSLKGRHPDRVNIDASTRFVGFDGYRKLLETDVDLVLLATPPAFRPLHFEAAVQAGKHIYAEKPIAVCAGGVQRFLIANERAKAQDLVIGVGFGRRRDAAYCETIRRLQEGAIGQIIFARAYNSTSSGKPTMRSKSRSELEFQLRNWLHFQWTSGDTIVEQHVQNLDVINWLLGTHPIEAQGIGGRNESLAPRLGDVFDHHTVEYSYRGGVKLLSMSRRCSATEGESSGGWKSISECPSGRARLLPNRGGESKSISEWAHGTEGWCDISAGKIFNLRNELVWRVADAGRRLNPIASLLAAIVQGDEFNEGDFAAESTLTAVMGRMAAYSGNRIGWEECLSNHSASADVDSLRSLYDPVPLG